MKETSKTLFGAENVFYKSGNFIIRHHFLKNSVSELLSISSNTLSKSLLKMRTWATRSPDLSVSGHVLLTDFKIEGRRLSIRRNDFFFFFFFVFFDFPPTVWTDNFFFFIGKCVLSPIGPILIWSSSEYDDDNAPSHTAQLAKKMIEMVSYLQTWYIYACEKSTQIRFFKN